MKIRSKKSFFLFHSIRFLCSMKIMCMEIRRRNFFSSSVVDVENWIFHEREFSEFSNVLPLETHSRGMRPCQINIHIVDESSHYNRQFRHSQIVRRLQQREKYCTTQQTAVRRANNKQIEILARDTHFFFFDYTIFIFLFHENDDDDPLPENLINVWSEVYARKSLFNGFHIHTHHN